MDNLFAFVENPAKSEAQRRYLNSQFGHDWVKSHSFDNKGLLPEKLTDNIMTFVTNANTQPRHQDTGQFLPTKGSSQKQTHAAVQKGSGQSSSSSDDSDDSGTDYDQRTAQDDAQGTSQADVEMGNRAYEQGMSTDEYKKKMGIDTGKGGTKNMRVTRQQVANAVAVLDAFKRGQATRNKKEKCPECGGEMDEDGECEDCGYREDEDDDDTRNDAGPVQPQQQPSAGKPSVQPMQPQKGQSNPDGRQNKKVVRQQPVDTDQDDDDTADTADQQGQQTLSQNHSFYAVANWCNQHGGTTCKSGSAGATKQSQKDSKSANDAHLNASMTGAKKDYNNAAKLHKSAAQSAVKAGKFEIAAHHMNMHRDAKGSAERSGKQSRPSKTNSKHPGNEDVEVVNTLNEMVSDGFITSNQSRLVMKEGRKVGIFGQSFTGNAGANMAVKAERDQFFGAIKDKGEYDPVEGGESHSEASKQATSASSHAKGEKGHKMAAEAHQKAANFHAAKANNAKEKGDMGSSNYHRGMANHHTEQKNYHKGFTANIRWLKGLIANCSCPTTHNELVQALNEASGTGDGSFDAAIMTGRSGTSDDSPGDDSDDDDDEYPEKSKKAAKAKGFSANQWLAMAPPEYRDQLVDGQKALQSKKVSIVRRLTANIADPDRQEMRQRQLMTNSLSDLQGLLELVGNQEQSHEPFIPLPMFGPETGWSGTVNQSAGDDVLDVPTMNFGKQEKQTA